MDMQNFGFLNFQSIFNQFVLKATKKKYFGISVCLFMDQSQILYIDISDV